MTYPSENFYPGFGTGTSSSASGLAQWAARVRCAVENVIADFAYWRSVHETTRQLSALDDAILRDIGLHRSQITTAARRMALAKRAGRRRPQPPRAG